MSAIAAILGSSPRMRRARVAALEGLASRGIIPAYAGSTWRSPRTRSSARDHPRVCGEHGAMSSPEKGFMGSSPRMRGAPRRGQRRLRPQGIIPAYAGSTSPPPGSCAACRDHPRVCGEHQRMNVRHELRRGSSPRMRGAHRVRYHVQRGRGIIPAYAGSTRWHSSSGPRRRDHPRVCGEHDMSRVNL